MITVGERWTPESCGRIEIHSADELIEYVLSQGFVPYFKGRVDGWSVEELCDPEAWWNDEHPESDPWAWRQIVAANENIAYGKFFENKAGFVSKAWFPCFASYRRDGYDFDSAWDDGLPGLREKRIIDAIGDKECYSCDLKRAAGFGKDGEKGYDAALLKLQMNSYVLIADFRRRVSKKGNEYGWHHTILQTPEGKWGDEHVRSAYSLSRDEAFALLLEKAKENAPEHDPALLARMICN